MSTGGRWCRVLLKKGVVSSYNSVEAYILVAMFKECLAPCTPKSSFVDLERVATLWQLQKTKIFVPTQLIPHSFPVFVTCHCPNCSIPHSYLCNFYVLLNSFLVLNMHQNYLPLAVKLPTINQLSNITVSFIGGGNLNTLRKPLSYSQSQLKCMRKV